MGRREFAERRKKEGAGKRRVVKSRSLIRGTAFAGVT